MTDERKRGLDPHRPESPENPMGFSEGELDKPPADIVGAGSLLGHPKGLWILFVTEMWERFSYYGMRALLVLFLVASTAEIVEGKANANPGFGWSEADAYALYGLYTFMVYLTSIFGGIAADRLLGTHRSMLVGGWIIALGHITLALTELFSFQAGQPVWLNNGPGALGIFLLGLALIIIGTGFFKPCVSVMVGQLYGEGDGRRDSGFTIFYMGINLGAFMSPIIAGGLGESIGWHWGFGAAAVGMIVGLIFYQFLRPRYLKGVGDPPEGGMARKDRPLVIMSMLILIGVPALPLILLFTNQLTADGPILSTWGAITGALGTWGMAATLTAILIASVSAFLAMQPKEERSRLAVIFILAILGNIFFWTAFEQAGSSMNIFAKESTDRTLGGSLGGDGITLWGLFDEEGFPATWYQSVNALSILLFAPVFGWLWVWLNKRRLNPSTPMKFAIGLWLLGLSFLAMVFGSMETRDGGLSGPQWLLITYVVYTWGELCLSPVGLSMVTKLAPIRLQSLMMGLWFFTLALSNLCAGLVARFSVQFKPGEDGSPPEMSFILDGMAGFYLMLVIFPIGAGVLIAILTPLLRKMMRGIH